MNIWIKSSQGNIVGQEEIPKVGNVAQEQTDQFDLVKTEGKV